ncbi:perforin-like protein 1 [Mytilus galloprovincialis]|uniref:perforin-like protein 1 n=1 Tax=Mytilus galloprovincialis TaxID=29158 RepID=UPI003F7C9877
MGSCWNLLPCVFSLLLIRDKTVLAAPAYMEEPIDDLVDGFRRQQMFMSTSLINASQNLGLPDRLAEAEVEEAEERAMLAFRRKNEAKTPFIATSSRLNVGYIGRGYDIYKGNPISEDGEVDQGFRLPVIDLPFSFRFTSDGAYRIPDNVDVISETSATFGSSYHQVKTETDYQSMLQVDVSVSAEAEGFGFSGSFSASTSYKKSVKEVTKGETTTLDIVGRANVYKARLSTTGTTSKLSDFLEDSIRVLPTEKCEEDVIQSLYIRVIEQFGTHYTTEVVMGAKAVQEFRFKNTDLDRFQSVGVSAKVAAQMSVKMGVFSGGAGFSVGVSTEESLREMVSNTEKEQREYYIGGSPPSGDYSSGSTETLREWARSAAENPAPIQYKLASIDAIIRPEYFKKKIPGLYEKRQCFRKALFRYCSSTISTYHCSLLSESEGNSAALKYGDFIKVRNGDRFLALSQHYGISPGLTIKPLTTVSEITNYDGLFQLVPPDGISDKLGSNIHYGEPFLLKTIEGDMLHIGRSILLNTDMPAETRLLDVFTDQDEAMNTNISYSPVADYSIFLKKEKGEYNES